MRSRKARDVGLAAALDAALFRQVRPIDVRRSRHLDLRGFRMQCMPIHAHGAALLFGEHRQGIALRPRDPLVQRRQHGKPPIFSQQPVRLARGERGLFEALAESNPWNTYLPKASPQGEQRVVPAALSGRRQLARLARQSSLGERSEPPPFMPGRGRCAQFVAGIELAAGASMAPARFPGVRRYRRALRAARGPGRSAVCQPSASDRHARPGAARAAAPFACRCLADRKSPACGRPRNAARE